MKNKPFPILLDKTERSTTDSRLQTGGVDKQTVIKDLGFPISAFCTVFYALALGKGK